MSTSLVYHAFGARTYDHTRTEFRGGAVYLHLTKKRCHQRCIRCGSKDVTLEGGKAVPVRCVPIGGRPSFLVLHLHFLRCNRCHSVRQESRDVAMPRKSYTKRMQTYVISLSRIMTVKDLAKHTGLGWDLIKEIIKTNLKRKLKKRTLRKVRRIAIDEVAIRKGRRYLTVVLDLDTGEVLFNAPGNDHACLEPFFRRLRKARAPLKAIAVDMSGAYAKAIKLWAPKGVTVVFDKFHVVALMNKVIEDVRRAEQSRLSKEGRKVLKGARFLLLYGIENLQKQDEQRPLGVPRLERLDALLEANETLALIYLLKEEFRTLWSQPSKKHAELFLDRWLEEAKTIDQEDLQTFVKTIESHREQILNYYDEPITTGPLEGLNNKIKVLKRVAYGYRDIEFFQLRVLFIHEVETKATGV
jgi:transposase